MELRGGGNNSSPGWQKHHESFLLCYFSFTYCYSAAYSELKPAAEGGVPLEHLISCVSGVYIKLDDLGVKRIIWQESRPSSPAGSSFSEASSTGEISVQ